MVAGVRNQMRKRKEGHRWSVSGIEQHAGILIAAERCHGGTRAVKRCWRGQEMGRGREGRDGDGV